MQFRCGLGANWIDDRQGVVGGFNFRYGVDVFPVKPWVFTAVLDLGQLGKADLVHFRFTAGVDWRRWQLYTGGDYRNIGSAHFFGPVGGVQMKF